MPSECEPPPMWVFTIRWQFYMSRRMPSYRDPLYIHIIPYMIIVIVMIFMSILKAQRWSREFQYPATLRIYGKLNFAWKAPLHVLVSSFQHFWESLQVFCITFMHMIILCFSRFSRYYIFIDNMCTYIYIYHDISISRILCKLWLLLFVHLTGSDL